MIFDEGLINSEKTGSMKFLINLISTIVFISFVFPGIARAQDGAALLEKMDKVMFSSEDKQGNVTMILTNKRDKEKVREAVMMQKGTEKRLYRYTAPESQAGIATLSLPGGVMWMYMPALGKPRKISILATTGAFNNTDFSYEDMATTPYTERYTPTLLETKSDAYILELVPKDENSQYSKIIVTLDKEQYYPELMEYYDQRGEKFKEAEYEYEKIGKYWNASKVVMTDLQKEHSTTILLDDVKFDQGIPDEVFTVESLAPEEN